MLAVAGIIIAANQKDKAANNQPIQTPNEEEQEEQGEETEDKDNNKLDESQAVTV